MRKGKINLFLMKTLTAGLLLSSVLPYQAFAAGSSDNVEDLLNKMKLTAEQRKALTEPKIGQVIIAPDINLKSSESVNVIIEFKKDPAKVEVLKQAAKGKKITLSAASKEAEENHKAFNQYVQKMKAAKTNKKEITPFNVEKQDVKITREYRNALNGVAMTLPGTDVESLLESGVVKRILKDNIVKIDPKEMVTSSDGSQIVQSSNENSIPLPGIETLYSQNIKGKGVKVGVLDTGIDYNHPDLTGAYKGFRAQPGVDPKTIDPTSVKGWDFIDGDADPMETTYKDWIDAGSPEGEGHYYTSHGTHVSGTIAGQGVNNVEFPALGVAPEVDLYVYRVLGPYGSGPESGIIAAIDKSVQDEMDVINLSLGVLINDPLLAESVAINNAMLSGVTCLVAAGNAGPNEKTLSSPGTSALGITVGASDFSLTIPTVTASVYESEHQDNAKTLENMKLLAKNYTDNLAELTGQSFPLMYAGLGGSSDFEGKDFTGQVALIERGTYALDEKVVNAKAAGAIAVVMYNNVDGEIPHYTGTGPKFIPSFRISKADGEGLAAMAQPVITFGAVGSTKTEGNRLADFSGRGPVTQNYDIKPDVVGPGVAVYSSYPEYINSPEDGIDYSSAYMRISGTSMATPHMAGIAALILQQNPTYTPFDVKAALMNTADDLDGNYSVYEVGAGEVDVVEAVHADVSIKVMDKTKHIVNDEIVDIDDITGSIMFGSLYKRDNGLSEESRNMVIQNRSGEEKKFNVEFEYLPEKPGIPSAEANHVVVTTSTSSVTVAAGQSVDLTATIQVPAAASMGRYEGYIHLVNSNNANEHYQIPFAVRLAEKGIDYMQLSNQAIMTKLPEVSHPFLEDPLKLLFFKLNSPMTTIDVLITDKDGHALGRTTQQSINAVDAPLDEDIYIYPVGGWMYPFTDPSHTSVSPTLVELPEGDYKVRMIATDADGLIFTKEQAFVVDNTLPEINFLDKAPGVYEVSDDMYTNEEIDGNSYRALWVHANVHDAALDSLAPNITQSANHLYYYENQTVYPDGEFPIQANGNVKFGVTPEDIAEHPLTLALFPVDKATNGRLVTDFRHYGFIKAGSDYVVPTYNKKKVYLGDEITMTLNLNNVQKLISGNYTVDYYKHFEFVDVKVNPAFKAMAAQKGLKVTVDKAVDSEHEWNEYQRSVKVGASITGNNFHGFDGDSAFLDVTFKLVDDKYYLLKDTMNIYNNIEEFHYKKDGETTETIAPVFNQVNDYHIIPKHSTIASATWAEALMDENGWLDWTKDFSKIGSKVYAKAADGKTYDGIIDPSGVFYIYDIPLSEKPYDIIVEVPGHLRSKLTVKLGKMEDGELIGVDPWLAPDQPLSYAGDVNSDGMIDIEDLKKAANAYGKSSKKEDLNQDGIVDEKDVRFIEKNFLRVDPDLKKSPKEKEGNKGLADYLRELGLEPMN